MRITDGHIGEAPSNSPSHDAQALDVLHQIGKHGEQQGNICQSPGSHQPSCFFRLRQQRSMHGCNGRHIVSDGRSNAVWEKLGTI